MRSGSSGQAVRLGALQFPLRRTRGPECIGQKKENICKTWCVVAVCTSGVVVLRQVGNRNRKRFV